MLNREKESLSTENYHYLDLCVYSISAGEEQCWDGSVTVNVLQCVLCVHNSIIVSLHRRVHIEWQWPLSDVHSIMMEKSAQPGVGGRCTPTSFHYIYHHVQCC